MTTPESHILKPIDPSITHSDDYEIFVLSNAQVVHETSGKPASLLAAYADTPLKVEGRLEPPDRSQLRCLVQKPYRPVDVVIRNVTRFSYGQMTDGELVIWAQGEAGWFELRPSRNYKTMYQDMVEAVELLYFVSDIYNQPRKKGGGPTAQLIFQEYAEEERYPCNDAAIAEQIFHKHHEFLMMCFLNRAQGIGWSNTPLYQYFRRQYPKVFEASKARIEGRSERAPTQNHPSNAAPSLTNTTAPHKPSASRSELSTQKSLDAPKKDDNWWEAAALYEFVRSAVNKRALKPGCGHITIDRVAKLITKRYEIDDWATAVNVLLVHAHNLCYKIEHPRSKMAAFLMEEPLYRELQVGHNLPAADIRKAAAVELRPRRDYAALHRYDSDDSGESADDVIKTPKRRSDGRKKQGTLSVLRPTGSKFSGKGKGIARGKGNGKAPKLEDSTIEEADSSAEAEAERNNDSDSVIEIDTPIRVLSPSRDKRKFLETGEDGEEGSGRRKRAASRSPATESQPSTFESDTDAAADTNNQVPLPLRYRASTKPSDPAAKAKATLVAPLVSTPLPTYEANGPRDSWICTFDGCSQRIYGVSKDIGRQLVTEHLEDHAKGREGVVGILLREEEKLRLPVDNLLRKIREMNEAKTPLLPSPTLDPTLQPQPIRRMV